MWIVELVKAPNPNPFSDTFFPRKIYYKTVANQLALEVKIWGGEAKVTKEVKKERVIYIHDQRDDI